ncbi:hypothetical protein ElyMa_005504400 [Elysia marginata]|uniref:Reverse transcriptase domain-containing protein n=1 Tax=Elysia marginata TaxID=1093978 RepID=A0AAV4EUN1_9GAST|nr:hypothetical protein ElyMa_005504400 [Elysia marginata]
MSSWPYLVAEGPDLLASWRYLTEGTCAIYQSPLAALGKTCSNPHPIDRHVIISRSLRPPPYQSNNWSNRKGTFFSNVGTPQGDSLSPVLFTIYLEHALKEVRPVLPKPSTPLEKVLPREIAYADGVDFVAFQDIDIEEVDDSQIPANQAMRGYFVTEGSKFKGRLLTTLPVVLNRDLSRIINSNLQLKSSHDLEHLRSIAQQRDEWTKITARIREAAEATQSEH